MMCTCRPIDHAFDDDIDQYIVPGRQDSPTTPTAATETGEQGEYTFESTLIHCAGCEALTRMQEGVNRMRVRAEVAQARYAIPPKEATEQELLAYLAADKDEQEDK